MQLVLGTLFRPFRPVFFFSLLSLFGPTLVNGLQNLEDIFSISFRQDPTWDFFLDEIQCLESCLRRKFRKYFIWKDCFGHQAAAFGVSHPNLDSPRYKCISACFEMVPTTRPFASAITSRGLESVHIDHVSGLVALLW